MGRWYQPPHWWGERGGGGLLELTPQLSLRESQRLSQLFLLHRAYKFPLVLHKIRLRSDSCCPRCGALDAHIMHMLWDCLSIGKFLNGVLNLIHKIYEITLPPQPKWCVLGLIGDVVCPKPKFWVSPECYSRPISSYPFIGLYPLLHHWWIHY